ncbi:hypothetical protein ARMGADRAFT_1091418 [Armillaria gallica]|uniref:Uncharacterized protein n=1 Tax=Armillaria gallica TaxID=47427 RepID=A0A2H3CWV0_ARMGA|nr:hypothetical protein ARMGADRAFT_1091418 [Armillaria gallica]
MAYDPASHRYLDLTIISTPLAFSVGKDNQLGSSETETPFSYSSTIDRPETFLVCFWTPSFLDLVLSAVKSVYPYQFRSDVRSEKGRRRVWHFLKVERVVSMTMIAVEMEGRAWFNWQSVLLLIVQYTMVFRFLESARKLDIGIAFQQFQREPAGW